MPPSTVAPKAEPRVATQSEAPKPAPVTRYVVQISASNTREEATAALRAAQTRYPDVLGGRHSLVKSKKSAENATVYAAQFGPFASRTEAAELCQRLKSAGGTCFVQ
jgi:cell division septation protein DedD